MFLLSSKGPYVCVNCGFPNNASVFKMYGNSVTYHSRSPSTAGTSSSLLSSAQNKSGMTHKLTECERCKKPVDEYVQLDFNILFLDAILMKQSFYRHILLNCTISNKNALKMAVIIGLCEAFQRWTTLNGVVSASDHPQAASDPSAASRQHSVSSKTYFQLEVSFYLIFLCVIIENALFYVIFYALFQLFGRLLPSLQLFSGKSSNRGSATHAAATAASAPQSPSISAAASVPLVDFCLCIIICSYGKLFIIPSYLYAGALKYIVDQLIWLFTNLSLVQLAHVKGHLFLNRFKATVLVALTGLLHHFSFYFLLIPVFRYLSSLIPIRENLLEDYLG